MIWIGRDSRDEGDHRSEEDDVIESHKVLEQIVGSSLSRSIDRYCDRWWLIST